MLLVDLRIPESPFIRMYFKCTLVVYRTIFYVSLKNIQDFILTFSVTAEIFCSYLVKM